MSYQPATVATKMLNRPAGGFVLTPEAAVKDMLRWVGKDYNTNGSWKFHFFGWMQTLMPFAMMQPIMIKTMKRLHYAKAEKGRCLVEEPKI